MAQPQHPWITENLGDALYNLADENIRYLYNNWVPLLGNDQDRERAIRGRLSIEAQLAEKIARVLDSRARPAEEKSSGRSRRSAAAPRRRLRSQRGSVEAGAAGLQPHRQRHRTDRLLRAKRGPARQIASPSARFARRGNAAPGGARIADRAATNFAAVNRIAGDRGPKPDLLAKKLQSMPAEAEVLSAMQPPSTGPAGPPPNAVRTQAKQKKLDEPFFHAYVEPILNKKGKDGYACANCHVTHTLFNATWSTVMNVVDTAAPEDSLILRKPTSTADSEGVVGSGQLAHGGGVRWLKGRSNTRPSFSGSRARSSIPRINEGLRR